ncbi:type II secretion system protein GspL [Paraburkholderia bonniea]|uniref:type II secretion system protein GspL n=1 Tax=Paraburkholderia bonniea TaxID=2152891 RepID=UPI0012909A07|nr:type II secretion system protein GspL [Paraburkholderia bonniea]WJF90311.1 type II secretion system protein GspL [Paraburkholderia bonniea]WJF93626.1 type II secretion system protein GspL [Paraburkholderia bonniea]
MSTLIVLLPPRDPAVPSQEWQLPDLPFLLLDKAGRTQRAGRSSLALLPRASTTILMIAARDLLMLAATVPPLKGPRLRQALPNIVEDQLIQDPQTCHIALDPEPLGGGRKLLAVIDRGWFRFICESFAAAGQRNLRAVPVMRCLPQATAVLAEAQALAAQAEAANAALAAAKVDAEVNVETNANADADPAATSSALPAVAPATPMVAAVLGMVVPTAPALLGEAVPEASVPCVELALVRGLYGEGLALPAAAVAPTLRTLAGEAPVKLYRLSDMPGETQRASSTARPTVAALFPGAQPLTFETLARRACDCRFDLCQFEFSVQPWRLDRALLRRLRVPVMLAVASVVIALIGANVQWLMLARQRDAIHAQMTELLFNAFPKTTVVLDAPDQMSRQLQQLRVAAGELSPDDFLSLADGLARSLGPVPVNGIAALDYHDHRLEVSFKPQIKVDPDLGQRLARNGLTGAIDSSTGKWTIRSGQ